MEAGRVTGRIGSGRTVERMTLALRDQTAIVGIGQSEYGRSLPDSQLSLGAKALEAAPADAGLTRADVDGVADPHGLDEGPRLTASVIGLPNEQLAVGLRVVVDFDDVTAEITLPRFRPAGG